jgi:subtilisin family serine protease
LEKIEQSMEEKMNSNRCNCSWNWSWVLLAAAVLIMTFLWNAPAPSAANSHQSLINYETDQLVVKLAADEQIGAINASYGTTTLRALLNSGGIYLLQSPAGQDALELAQMMTNDGRLLYAEPNYIGAAPEAYGVEIYGWPDGDPLDDDAAVGVFHNFSVDSAPEPARFTNQPARQNLHLTQAHSYSRGAGMVVAVLDTGVDLTHPLLASRLTAAQYDFIDDDPIAQDEFAGLDENGQPFNGRVAGHGTHIAGIIRLVAPDAQIMPLRVLDANGQGNIFIVAEAMLFAAANGADVINLSLGSVYQSDFMTDVLDQLAAQNVVVVGAAGNLNMNIPQYPAAADCSLAVTAVGLGPVKTRYASYGSWVDLAAPGERVYSAFPGGGYAWWSGTSMAAPFVSGQIALLRSVNPSLTQSQIGQIIGATVQPIDAQNQHYNGQLGLGRIDIGGSLAYLSAGQWQSAPSILLNGCD